MNVFNIAICDDEIEFVLQIEKHIKKLDKYQFETTIFKSGEDLISSYEEKKYDIILLDMEMKDVDGIDTANIIREIDRNVIIIFITSHRKYMERSFECQPFRYLVKPVEYEKFENTLFKACECIEIENPVFTFQDGKSIVRLNYNDILYFENKSHWIHIYTYEQEYRTYMTFSKLMKNLDLNLFAVTHKSYIINLNYVKELVGNDIKLRNNLIIPLSRNYKNEVKQKVLNFKERKYCL